jgi:hypothetical protein
MAEMKPVEDVIALPQEVIDIAVEVAIYRGPAENCGSIYDAV